MLAEILALGGQRHRSAYLTCVRAASSLGFPLSAATVERINKEADPLGFLIQVAKGNRITAALAVGDKKRTWTVPTLDQRIDANNRLLRKILPDLKNLEVSGDGLFGSEVASSLSLRGRDKLNGGKEPSVIKAGPSGVPVNVPEATDDA